MALTCCVVRERRTRKRAKIETPATRTRPAMRGKIRFDAGAAAVAATGWGSGDGAAEGALVLEAEEGVDDGDDGRDARF
jgi:hypothetical protein